MHSPALSLSKPELLACCGSHAWAERMARLQPFISAEQMLEAADRVWWELTPTDWLEAFSAHPRIGEKGDAVASAEQSGVRDAAQDILTRIMGGNRVYEQRFGYIYIVCASGKSATEMIEILESRLRNDKETELRIAAEQQRQITRLRLEKWLISR